MKRTACALSVIIVFLSAGPAAALQLSPLDFTSLGTLSTTGDIILNTDTLQLSGGVSFTGVLDSTSQAAVFAFDTIQAANVSVFGSNPLALLSKGNAIFNGIFTSSNAGGLEITADGSLSVANGASISVSNGSTLSIFAQDVLLSGKSSVASGGTIALGTTHGLVPQGPVVPQGDVATGSITITSGSRANLLGSFNAYNIQLSEVPLFTGGIALEGGTVTGLMLVPGSIEPVIVGVAPVPVPPALFLFATGLVVCGAALRHRIK